MSHLSTTYKQTGGSIIYISVNEEDHTKRRGLKSDGRGLFRLSPVNRKDLSTIQNGCSPTKATPHPRVVLAYRESTASFTKDYCDGSSLEPILTPNLPISY